MLLIQFSTMVIDRALYLRKTVLGKLIFQVILVFGIHLWMFFILPAVTERYRGPALPATVAPRDERVPGHPSPMLRGPADSPLVLRVGTPGSFSLSWACMGLALPLGFPVTGWGH